ncbi:MAG: hypothetical protein AAF564_24650 [Bacteroidota bacterium]
MYVLIGLLMSIWLLGPVDDAVVDSAPLTDACVVVDPDPPPYYQIDLVTTRKVPGAGVATGVGTVVYKSTPFGIAVGADGSYIYNLDIKVDRMAPARKGTYVAWVSTPQLDNIKQLGPLEAGHQISGEVDWNKFLVIITLEETVDPDQPRWKGPVVLRGLSRSGYMHTMAGHGPYESEPCAVYGY